MGRAENDQSFALAPAASFSTSEETHTYMNQSPRIEGVVDPDGVLGGVSFDEVEVSMVGGPGVAVSWGVREKSKLG